MPLVLVEEIGRSVDSDSFVIDVPAGLRTKSDLMAVLSMGGRFPDYFGGNWDALHDCLTDFSWIDKAKIILAHRDIPLEGDRNDCRTYLDVVSDAADSDRLVVEFPVELKAELARLLPIIERFRSAERGQWRLIDMAATPNRNCSETYASLRLMGVNIEPRLVTEIMGFDPDFSARIGDVIPKGSLPRREGMWAFRSEGRVHSSDLEDHLVFILKKLNPDFRRSLPSGTRCDMFCLWRSATGHGGPVISPATMAELAGHGIELGLDFYSDLD